ncbi:MAG: hypothetical protein KAY32_01905 [Candidatus Eisenbacteria sp.]|nr:hypothetical protein [Candidatus Eisenbacteria bacterium]
MGMRNCYKRDDIFTCRQEVHRRFDHRVSAFHVLCEKGCYPEGCVSFVWKCKLLGKGGRCPKGYRHVGSNCTQCRYYDEEKIHAHPELQVSAEAYVAFLAECAEFDEWLAGHARRPVEVGGRVSDIRPCLVKVLEGSRARTHLRGFLLRLERAYVGLQGFDDPIYLPVSRGQQERLRLAAGDRVEAEAWVRLDRGRLLGDRPRRLRVEERGGEAPPRWDGALLDCLGAVPLHDQPERCLRCERGVLVDVETPAGPGGPPRGRRRRELLCLEGIGRPNDCPYQALRELRAGVTVGLGEGRAATSPGSARRSARRDRAQNR